MKLELTQEQADFVANLLGIVSWCDHPIAFGTWHRVVGQGARDNREFVGDHITELHGHIVLK